MVHPPRRLFVGLIPERDVQLRIQRHCREWQWPTTARPTRFGRFHLTLQFLGDEVALAPEMIARKALRRVPLRPFELELGIPRLWQRGVAVLQPRPHPGLAQLRQDVADALSSAGLRIVKKYEPHVTLARGAHAALPPRAEPSIAWPVQEFLLVWSRMPPEVKPARYELLEHFKANDLRPLPSHQAGEQSELFG